MKALTIKQNTSLVLNKSKSTLKITNRILSGKTSLVTEAIKDWIKKLWIWADRNDIDSNIIPRSEDLLRSLETIDLSGLGLDSISSRLCFLEYATTLNLADNHIRELPKEILNFRNLKVLNLKNNPLVLTQNQQIWIRQIKEKGCEVYLNSDVIEYPENKDLIDDSWMNRLWEWADENDISELHFVENKRKNKILIGLPRDKERLLGLTQLNLVGKQLTQLPKEIGNLANLTALWLNYNHLTGIPKEIGNLVNLKNLDLSYNLLVKIPKEIGNLTHLNTLYLFENKLTELPKEINKLINLPELALFENKIKVLPKGIGSLNNLTSLVFSANQLVELPKEIGNLLNLTILELDLNQLTELPKEIVNLVNLTSLNLNENPNLILTIEQKEWIEELKANGCKVKIDAGIVAKSNTLATVKNTRDIKTVGRISDNPNRIIEFEDNIDAWIDRDTGLMWEVKNKENIYHGYVWSEEYVKEAIGKDELTDNVKDALSYAKKLNAQNYAGFNDWRIPTTEELETLISKERNNNNLYIKAPLSSTSSNYYWSSTTYAGYSDLAWGVGFSNGYQGGYFKTFSYYVRCVRAGQ